MFPNNPDSLLIYASFTLSRKKTCSTFIKYLPCGEIKMRVNERIVNKIEKCLLTCIGDFHRRIEREIELPDIGIYSIPINYDEKS